MKLGIKMAIVLTSISLLSGLSLSYTYSATKKDIKQNKEKEKEVAIKVVLPETFKYKEKTIDKKNLLITSMDRNGNTIGYALLTEGSGFQGPIKLMIGFDTTLSTITGMEVLENVETPGLGNRIAKPWFKKQFKGRKPPITYVKGHEPEKDNEIMAISGATISSKSVVKIVNNAFKTVKKELCK